MRPPASPSPKRGAYNPVAFDRSADSFYLRATCVKGGFRLFIQLLEAHIVDIGSPWTSRSRARRTRVPSTAEVRVTFRRRRSRSVHPLILTWQAYTLIPDPAVGGTHPSPVHSQPLRTQRHYAAALRSRAGIVTEAQVVMDAVADLRQAPNRIARPGLDPDRVSLH